jgi:deazaflavin-dependent oxidoreductase (nitroreductase family)
MPDDPLSATPAATLRDEKAVRLKAGFRHVNRLMVALWRLGLGPMVNSWPKGSGRILVLGHHGRRSGLRHWTPLNYVRVDGHIYCTSGFGTHADWYRNVTARPGVEVWLPNRRAAGVVEDVSVDPDRVRLLREVLLASGFAARAAGVDPRRLDDEALAAATAAYRLLKIREVDTADPLPAHPRPGDLAWIWAATLLPAALVLARQRRSREGPEVAS